MSLFIATMGLDCYKIIESENGWASENYLRYCKFVKRLYHSIIKLKEIVCNEPTSAVINWR